MERTTGRSSNGKTADSGSAYRGSSPCLPAKLRMKIARFLLLLLPVVLFAQESDVFDKAPPDVDEALRARLDKFYQAYVEEKYRVAYEMVSEEFKDEFFASPKPTYKSCQIVKISYTDNFTKANATIVCKGVMKFHGTLTTTIPVTSLWRVENGQWMWYALKRTGPRVTPFGLSSAPEDNSETPMPSIPADPQKFAEDILNLVRLDKPKVVLKGYETSKDSIHVKNGMPGVVHLQLDIIQMANFSMKIDKTELKQGEQATIDFAYTIPDKPDCAICARKEKPTMTANLHVLPTGRLIPIKIVFDIPPEIKKQLPTQ